MQDLGTGLNYLQPAKQLTKGGTFKLDPYSHHVFSNFSAISDHDGRWRELWERYGDIGHPDLNAAYESLLLEPLNDLAQQLYDLSNPESFKTDISELNRRIWSELRSPQLQQLSPPRYLELQVQAAFPNDQAIPKKLRHELQQLLAFDGRLPSDQLYCVLDRLFNRREWRKLFHCNYHNDTDWFNKESFDRILLIFFKFLIFVSHQGAAADHRSLLTTTLGLLVNLRKARALAESCSYKVDNYLQCLQGERPAEPVIQAAIDSPSSLKILFVTPEATPFAKTGGLADVAGSLPHALRQKGHDVRVILPCHRSAERSGISLVKGPKSVEIILEGIAYRGSLKQTAYDGVPYWFVDCPEVAQPKIQLIPALENFN